MAHRDVNAYRSRVSLLLRSVLEPHLPVTRALDFGCGDGWFASTFKKKGLANEVVAVEMRPRKHSHSQVLLYDGERLPFEDREFELAYSVDVLHHCPSPRASLNDLLVEDHTHRSWEGRLALCLLDKIGNRRLGLPSITDYEEVGSGSHIIRTRPTTVGGLGLETVS